MSIRDHELHPVQATPSQLAQELGPEGLGLGRPDIESQHLTPAVAVDADSDDRGNRDAAAGQPATKPVRKQA
jgi:hypothetical protein